MENSINLLESIANTDALDNANKEILELESLSEELLSENEKLEKEINNLSKKDSENLERISNLKEKIFKNEKKISELKNNLEEIFNSEIKKLSGYILEKEISEGDLDNEKKSEILKNSLDRFLELKKENDLNKREILVIQKDLEDSLGEKKDLEGNNASRREELENLNLSLKELRNEKEILKQDVDKNKKEIEEKSKKILELEEKYKKLMDYNSVITENDRKKINELEEEISQNEKSISILLSLNQNLENKFLEIGKKLLPNENYTKESFDSQEKISEFFIKIFEKIEHLVDNFYKGAKEEIEEKNSKNKNLSKLIDKIKGQKNYLVENKKELEGDNLELLNQVEDLTRGLKFSDDEIKILKKSLDESLLENNDLENFIKKLEEKLELENNSKKVLISVVNNLSKEGNKISEELEKIKKEKNQLEYEISNITKKSQEVLEDNLKLKGKIEGFENNEQDVLDILNNTELIDLPKYRKFLDIDYSDDVKKLLKNLKK